MNSKVPAGAPETLPTPPVALTIGGIIPFAALASWIAFSTAPPPFAGQALVAYGALIVTFLGGVHWGDALTQGSPTWGRLTMGIAPCLYGWVALLVPTGIGVVMLALAFPLLFVADIYRSLNHWAPSWYPTLRLPPSVIATGSMVFASLSFTF